MKKEIELIKIQAREDEVKKTSKDMFTFQLVSFAFLAAFILTVMYHQAKDIMRLTVIAICFIVIQYLLYIGAKAKRLEQLRLKKEEIENNDEE